MNLANVPIDPDVFDVLKSSVVDEKSVTLTCPQLDRKLYQQVNDALTRIGGKWNKKAKAHLFEDDPRPLFVWMLETGQMPPKNPTAYFPTPASLASRMADLIPASAQTILEPSAGTGHIARAIREACPDATLDCCEVLPKFQEKLKEQGFNLVAEDFLSYRPRRHYDAVLMNPPFSLDEDKMAYVTHIMHAWSLVAPGGLLVAIAPGGVTFSQDKRVKALNALIDAHGSTEELSEGAFKESGTGVRTVLITLHKEASAIASQSSSEVESENEIPAPDQTFRSTMLSLTEELNQLEEEGRKIHAQLNRNMAALLGSEPVQQKVEVKAPQKPIKPTQMSLWQ